MAEVRLQKFLSAAGVASRRKAETMIQLGRIGVNGERVKELGTKVDPSADTVTLDGEEVKLPATPLYYVMNKPRATVCTENDPERRQRVHELLPPGLPRMFTIGRLDYDTEGVLLFTTDGDLAKGLTDPARAVPKVYEVKIQGEPDPHLLRRFNEGVNLDDGTRTKPAPTELVHRTKTNAWYEVVLIEGKNRQIHRMAAACGKRVLKLRRISFGAVEGRGLKTGQVRQLVPDEINALRKDAGVKAPERIQKKKKASARKPSASKPSASKPSARKPSARKPSARKPSASKPSASRPSASKPSARKPSQGRPKGAGEKKGIKPRRKR